MPDHFATRRRTIVAVAAAVSVVHALNACATGGGGSGGGSPGGAFGRRDERQFIGSFAEVREVAVSRRYVFSATPSGIGVFDRLVNAWLPPLTRDNGFTDIQITVMAADPAEDAVWYGVPGAIVSYRPQVEQLQRTMIAGVPDFIAFDKSPLGDLYVRAGGAWTRVSRTGLASPMARPPAPAAVVVPRTLADVYAQFPALRSQQALLFRNQQADRALRSYAVLSGAVSPERSSEVWLGTSGDGLYKVDPTFQQSTALRFGPLTSDIGAVALASDGVWMAGLGQSPLRAGLSFARNDLQQWRWIDGTIAVPLLGVRTNTLVVRAQRAWVGTERGLVRVRLDAGEAMAAWTTLDGMPDERVYALAATDAGVWAGTARGLVWVTDSSDSRNTRTRGIAARVLDNTSVFALQLIGDTLWAGTSTGLVALPGAGRMESVGATGLSTIARPVSADPALRRPIRALAWSDSILLAATDDGVVQLTPRRASEPVRVPALDVRLVGSVRRLLMDDRTVWMAGADGLLVTPRNGGAPRLLRAPGDLPGPVTDIAASRDWLWVGTTVGIVRFRRMVDGGLP